MTVTGVGHGEDRSDCVAAARLEAAIFECGVAQTIAEGVQLFALFREPAVADLGPFVVVDRTRRAERRASDG
ncbi:MAG: hypothetical protein ACXVI3_03875 [Halobacteriota archaeon]